MSSISKVNETALCGLGICETPLGELVHYWTQNGLYRLQIVGREKREFNHARISQEDDTLNAEIDAVSAEIESYFAGEISDFLNVRIDTADWTPFFGKVYAACRQVPPGETISYAQLAAKAGSPNAARAAGQAMARNRIPLLIPCHRIVGTSGALTGFSAPGGTNTKRRLLDHECRKEAILFS